MVFNHIRCLFGDILCKFNSFIFKLHLLNWFYNVEIKGSNTLSLNLFIYDYALLMSCSDISTHDLLRLIWINFTAIITLFNEFNKANCLSKIYGSLLNNCLLKLFLSFKTFIHTFLNLKLVILLVHFFGIIRYNIGLWKSI